MPRNRLVAAIALALLSSCSMFRSGRTFKVLPRTPNDVLRSPDSRETPFSGILRAYNGFDPARSWMDLRALMELRIENAYYAEGASRRGLEGFLGTEVARYEIKSVGLQLLSVEPMKERPEGEVPVQELISVSALHYRFYRLYFEIVFTRTSKSHGSVLLGAKSLEELNQLSAQLSQPETVCYASAPHCAVFPEACSVSVEMKIVVNGAARAVIWGSLLESVAENSQHLEVKRLYAGRLTRIELNPRDSNVLKMPLLPGDEITTTNLPSGRGPSP